MRLWLQSKGAEGEPPALAGASLSVTDVRCGDRRDRPRGAIGASAMVAFSLTTMAEGGEGGRRLQRREARAEKAMLASRKPPLTTVNATITQNASAGAKASTRPATKITAP